MQVLCRQVLQLRVLLQPVLDDLLYPRHEVVNVRLEHIHVQLSKGPNA